MRQLVGASLEFNKARRSFKEAARRLRVELNAKTSGVTTAEGHALTDSMRDLYKNMLQMIKLARIVKKELNNKITELNTVDESLKKCYDEFDRFAKAKARSKIDVYFDKECEKRVATEVKRKQQGLKNMQDKVNKLEQELIINQEDLQTRIQDTNLAKSSYYYLTDAEIDLFNNQREKILKGVEKWGNITLACKMDKSITMKVSSIMHYAQKHKQFHEDIEIARQVFKDNLDSVILDRAINGTRNPVFQKGEYIGDYAVKDNKLLVDVAKAKLPETYNPKVVAEQSAGRGGGTTINIVSFDGVDETKYGYARNIGVVKSVDDTGRVERITQRNKDGRRMIDFYKAKGDTEIVVDAPRGDEQQSEEATCVTKSTIPATIEAESSADVSGGEVEE